ncbi:phosphoadenosine phosphosulfate reductase family protein [Azospirillum brasilense]|uniref:phosphoadenosine phosphosulfate reductase domain-containing protein n=1 Tax=Azospirillum brasilense TaxID=192 RepID=UPI001FFEC2B3|nr:phosphoadenosine phosphosulfate reductase family protein [Azospirillum brasilense]
MNAINRIAPAAPIAVVSVSGGKDSTATALRAIDEYGHDRCRFVFADTGHEHELTTEYLTDYLPGRLNARIDVVKADFSFEIARKRIYVAEKWPAKLVAGKVGKWVRLGTIEEDDAEPPPPENVYLGAVIGGFVWSPAIRAMSEEEAAEVVARALAVLHPTGIPYLDLCLWKGRFPSRKAQFCTQFLKRHPLDRYTFDLIEKGFRVESWQGVRRDESDARRDAAAREWTPEGWEIVRPIVDWTAQQTVDFVVSRGVKLNPLYSLGCSRVGCMLCINEAKDGIANAARRWPHHINRIREWEWLVGQASKRGFSTLLHHSDGEGGDAEFAFRHCNIDAMVDWSKTTRGGKQYGLLRVAPPPTCSSVYGLCE